MRPFVLIALFAAACGPEAPMDTASSTGEVPGTATSTTTGLSTTSGPATTTTTITTDAPTTTGDPGTGTSTTTTGLGFIMPPDGGGCIAPFGEYEVRCSQCDPWWQNCPPGEKCSPHAEGPDGEWSDLKCVPLVVDPDHPGEPCTAISSPTSGIDSCDIDSVCFHVDPDTLVGTCVAMCDGSPDDPQCPADTACRISHDGVLALCLRDCDPLLTDCPAGQVCIPTAAQQQAFVCVDDASGAGGQEFGACDELVGCDPGFACVDPASAVECDPQATGCCLPYCDVTLPPACPAVDHECLPLFPGGDLPLNKNVGVCGLPP